MRSQLQKLVKNFSIETTPYEAVKIKSFGRLLPKQTRVFIAHTSKTTFEDIFELARRLKQENMIPVPHIVARRFKSIAFLEDFLFKLTSEAGVTEVLVVAGDLPKPLGPLENSMQILELGVLEKNNIQRVYISAHPEGHKGVSEQVLRDSLVRKNFYAKRRKMDVRIITQFTFFPESITDWESAHGRAISQLPYSVGVLGLVSHKEAAKRAQEFGIKKPSEEYSLDRFLLDLIKYKKENPKSLLQSVHFYPFGNLAKTAVWANKLMKGKFKIMDKGSRIKI